ncbi:unnamed protein product [Amoebophrya sp. A25]|nr:unnamed protein product [Amoebophrya sp. A25]|eukprot:GSA25T00005456001.1
MVVSAEDARQLKIKLGTVKRSKKEYDFYVKEEIKQRDTVKQMTEAGRDKYDIKQQQECLNETLTVLPEAKKRLEKYAVELNSFLKEAFPDELEAISTASSGAEDGVTSEDQPKELVEAKTTLDELAERDADFKAVLEQGE